MKVNKLFSIDHEIATLLSNENNASALVNMLLQQYYSEKVQDFEKKNTRTEARTEENQSKNEGTEEKL